jgi:hypothetical protein
MGNKNTLSRNNLNTQEEKIQEGTLCNENLSNNNNNFNNTKFNKIIITDSTPEYLVSVNTLQSIVQESLQKQKEQILKFEKEKKEKAILKKQKIRESVLDMLKKINVSKLMLDAAKEGKTSIILVTSDMLISVPDDPTILQYKFKRISTYVLKSVFNEYLEYFKTISNARLKYYEQYTDPISQFEITWDM